MRSVAVRNRHRAHDSTASHATARSRVLGIVGTAALVITGPALWIACGAPSVPHPVHVQVRAEDYVAVPFEPRAPPVELLPARPAASGNVVWADGGWEWNGDRYRWEPGGWVISPEGAVRARWVIVRRAGDGQLFFAPSTWRDAAGRTIEGPTPLARASTRAGVERGAGGAGGERGAGSAGGGLDD